MTENKRVYRSDVERVAEWNELIKNNQLPPEGTVFTGTSDDGWVVALTHLGRVMVFAPNIEPPYTRDKACAAYSSPNNFLEHHYTAGSPMTMDQADYEESKPPGPFLPRADVDNAMYYVNEKGEIIVYSEEEAALWARMYVKLQRKAFEEGRDPTKDPEIKAMQEKYPGIRWIARYKTYDDFFKYHCIGEPDPETFPDWFLPEDKEHWLDIT